MKKFIAFMAALLVGCGKSGDKGELVRGKGDGILRAMWYDFSTGRCFTMGKSDDDGFNARCATNPSSNC
jgi:hypothetical protein